MNNYRKGLYAAVFSAMLAGTTAPALAESADAGNNGDAASAASVPQDAQVLSQPLNGVVVTGSSSALFRADQRLALVNASLPLDAKAGASQSSTLEQVIALFPDSPDEATGPARRMMERGNSQPEGPDPDAGATLGLRW